MDEEARLGLAGQLLRDEAADPRDRLAAILVLLFGQPATKIALLRAGAVTIDDGQVHLALGETPYGCVNRWHTWPSRSRDRQPDRTGGCSPEPTGQQPLSSSGTAWPRPA